MTSFVSQEGEPFKFPSRKTPPHFLRYSLVPLLSPTVQGPQGGHRPRLDAALATLALKTGSALCQIYPVPFIRISSPLPSQPKGTDKPERERERQRGRAEGSNHSAPLPLLGRVTPLSAFPPATSIAAPSSPSPPVSLRSDPVVVVLLPFSRYVPPLDSSIEDSPSCVSPRAQLLVGSSGMKRIGFGFSLDDPLLRGVVCSGWWCRPLCGGRGARGGSGMVFVSGDPGGV